MNIYASWPNHEDEPPPSPVKVEGWLLALFALVVFVIFMFGAIAASHSQERHGGRDLGRGGEHGFSGHPGGSQGHPGVWRHGGGGYWGHRNDDIAGGILGGFLGGLASQLFPPDPEPPTVVVVQPPPQAPVGPKPWSPEWFAYCAARYKSFQPDSGNFTGNDGNQYFCR